MIITATVTIKMDATITGIIVDSARILGLVAVLLGQFMLVLDATVVNVALPAMQADLALLARRADLDHQRLHDRVRRPAAAVRPARRRARPHAGSSCSASPCFTLASIACGFAPTALALIVARFVQGIGAAAASSVILAIIATEFPRPADRAKAMSGYMFVSVSGGSLGLFVGGLLTAGAELALDLLDQRAGRR